MNWLKDSFKMVVSIVGALAIIATLIAFYSSLATSEDLNKAKAEIKAENSVVIKELRKDIELKSDLDRLDRINDNLIKAKILQKTYPKDKEIKEDIKDLKAEKEKIKQKIEKKDK